MQPERMAGPLHSFPPVCPNKHPCQGPRYSLRVSTTPVLVRAFTSLAGWQIAWSPVLNSLHLIPLQPVPSHACPVSLAVSILSPLAVQRSASGPFSPFGPFLFLLSHLARNARLPHDEKSIQRGAHPIRWRYLPPSGVHLLFFLTLFLFLFEERAWDDESIFIGPGDRLDALSRPPPGVFNSSCFVHGLNYLCCLFIPRPQISIDSSWSI